MTELSKLLNELNRNELSTRRIEDEAAKLGHKLNFTTAARYLSGRHPKNPSATVLDAFAAVFRVDPNRLRDAAGLPPLGEPFELPPEARALDPDERQAIINLVRVMARRKDGDGSDSRSAAPMSRLDAARRAQEQADTRPMRDIAGLAADEDET